MYRLSKRVKTLDRSPGGDPSAKGITPVAAARLASTLELMGTRDQLAIPRLVGAARKNFSETQGPEDLQDRSQPR